MKKIEKTIKFINPKPCVQRTSHNQVDSIINQYIYVNETNYTRTKMMIASDNDDENDGRDHLCHYMIIKFNT